jgi:hypothetical protein
VGIFSNAFEKKWFLIFMFMYFLIMVPFPFYFSQQYIPFIVGIPLFVFGWLAHALVVLGLIFVFFRQCMNRREYHEFDD